MMLSATLIIFAFVVGLFLGVILKCIADGDLLD